MLTQVYRDDAAQWRWRIWGDNNSDMLADSGQSYSDKSECLLALNKIKGSGETPVLETKSGDKPSPDDFLAAKKGFRDA